jgi:hypothetical protein
MLEWYRSGRRMGDTLPRSVTALEAHVPRSVREAQVTCNGGWVNSASSTCRSLSGIVACLVSGWAALHTVSTWAALSRDGLRDCKVRHDDLSRHRESVVQVRLVGHPQIVGFPARQNVGPSTHVVRVPCTWRSTGPVSTICVYRRVSMKICHVSA